MDKIRIDIDKARIDIDTAGTESSPASAPANHTGRRFCPPALHGRQCTASNARGAIYTASYAIGRVSTAGILRSIVQFPQYAVIRLLEPHDLMLDSRFEHYIQMGCSHHSQCAEFTQKSR